MNNFQFTCDPEPLVLTVLIMKHTLNYYYLCKDSCLPKEGIGGAGWAPSLLFVNVPRMSVCRYTPPFMVLLRSGGTFQR